MQVEVPSGQMGLLVRWTTEKRSNQSNPTTQWDKCLSGHVLNRAFSCYLLDFNHCVIVDQTHSQPSLSQNILVIMKTKWIELCIPP